MISTSDDIDPVGACIGARGSRIQNVLSELRNEKIDIVRFSEDPVDHISNALSPAEVVTVALFDDNEGKRAEVTVAADQLSLAIGRGGQNVRLAAKLTGWKIDIKELAGSAAPVEEPEDLAAEETEAVVEEAVAVVEETEAVVEEAVAVVEETVAVVEETVAVVEETEAAKVDTDGESDVSDEVESVVAEVITE